MTDQVYFIGYRAEQFTGWDGIGSPSYSSVSSSNSLDPNSVGSISLTSSGNVIWKDLNISGLDPVYLLVELQGQANAWSQTSTNGNIVITDGKNYVKIYSINDENLNFYMERGTYSSSGVLTETSRTSLYSKYGNGKAVIIKFFIELKSSSNTVYDGIKITCDIGNSGTITELFDGSMTSTLNRIQSIFSYKFGSDNQCFYYCAVANFDLTGAYIDYTTVSAEGSLTDWSGTASTLNTYPINTSIPANGMYSYSAGNQVTFKPSKQLSTGSGLAAPKAVFIDSSMLTSNDDLGYTAAPILKSSTSNITYTLGSPVTPTATDTNYQWISYQNPSNLSSWNISDINSQEFGMKRIN